MNRRFAILLLIGMITAITGLSAISLLRQQRCEGMRGQWSPATRACQGLPTGAEEVARTTDVIIGVILALLVALMLYRVYLFVTGRAQRRLTTAR